MPRKVIYQRKTGGNNGECLLDLSIAGRGEIRYNRGQNVYARAFLPLWGRGRILAAMDRHAALGRRGSIFFVRKVFPMNKVAVIMGSDSDWPVVKAACAELDRFGVPYEAHIMSAHRTPAAAAEFARGARENGFGAIICAAGMAAHLAGAFAANTTLPVIGIPMKGGAADGLDALLSTVQMPSGIPVATVALNGAKNAAVLAVQILAVSDGALARKLEDARRDMAKQIGAKEAMLQKELGL